MRLALLLLIATAAFGQVHVGVSRLGEKQVKSEISGATDLVALWQADICNDTAAVVRIDKARVRNLMRSNGVPVIADSEGVTISAFAEKTGPMQVIKRGLGYLTDGCLAYGIADADWRILAICGGFKVLGPRVEGSLAARTPESAVNLARFSSTPRLELAAGACGEMVLFASPDNGPIVYPPTALPLTAAAPAAAPATIPVPSPPGFTPSSWLALRQQAQPSATLARWRAIDESWKREEQIADAYMNQAELDTLAGVR